MLILISSEPHPFRLEEESFAKGEPLKMPRFARDYFPTQLHIRGYGVVNIMQNRLPTLPRLFM